MVIGKRDLKQEPYLLWDVDQSTFNLHEFIRKSTRVLSSLLSFISILQHEILQKPLVFGQCRRVQDLENGLMINRAYEIYESSEYYNDL